MLACNVFAELLCTSSSRRYNCRFDVLTKHPYSCFPNYSQFVGSNNLLYILFSPWCKHLYVGRTINLYQRHWDHFRRISHPEKDGQLPAYYAMRKLLGPDPCTAAACFFMIPVFNIPGDLENAVVCEKLLIDSQLFSLNTPLVYSRVRASDLKKLRPDLYFNPSDCTCVAHAGKPSKSLKRLWPTRDLHTCAIPRSLQTALNNRRSSKIDLGFRGLCFDNTPLCAKLGLAKFWVCKDRNLICELLERVWGNVHGKV